MRNGFFPPIVTAIPAAFVVAFSKSERNEREEKGRREGEGGTRTIVDEFGIWMLTKYHLEQNKAETEDVHLVIISCSFIWINIHNLWCHIFFFF